MWWREREVSQVGNNLYRVIRDWGILRAGEGIVTRTHWKIDIGQMNIEKISPTFCTNRIGLLRIIMKIYAICG